MAAGLRFSYVGDVWQQVHAACMMVWVDQRIENSLDARTKASELFFSMVVICVATNMHHA
jgi:hypothetical protein